MSYRGKLSPLALNVQSSLLNNQGFRLNPESTEKHGTWTPSTVVDGEIITTTLLNNITKAKRNFYDLVVSSTLDVSIYRNLLMIGRPVDRNDNRINFPAMGNTKPDSFVPTYAGYGTWDTKIVDEFNNVVSSGSLNLITPEYPPKQYPSSSQYSYISNNWGSTTSGSFNYDFQWNYPYAWVTSWPDRASFQETTDSYSAAYYPRPDLRSRDQSLIEYDSYFKNGFISTVARQAYYELYSDYNSRRPNQYKEIVKSFLQHYSWKSNKNQNISSIENGKTFLRGNFSNINDITTNDISGVSLSFKIFGNDLIRLGKALDLPNIDKFGLPSEFLRNLRRNNAVTEAVKFYLLYKNFTTLDLNNILNSDYIPTVNQEKNIYEALKLVRSTDLQEVLIILNCSTQGLTNLMDLINPKMMFPNSYTTLTVPTYSIATLSSKTYDFIYLSTGVNSRITNFATYLKNIVDDELATACGAFMMTMSQIKNIKKMNNESFSQVVSNLEVTNKDLPLINSTSGVPVNTELVNHLSSISSLGSGKNGTYRFCDFYGAASGRPYNNLYDASITLLKKLSTTNLETVFLKLFQKSKGNGWVLPSRAKGWSDPVINPSPTLNHTYAYSIFVTQEQHAINTDVITTQSITTTIFTPGVQVCFSADPGPSDPIYTVQSSVINGPVTEITLTSQLTQTVPKGSIVYIYETDYNGYPSGPVQDLIDAANVEILRIQNLFSEEYEKLNTMWSLIGKQLSTEQRAITTSIPSNELIIRDITDSDVESFVKNIENYAPHTQEGEVADVLEAIADISNIGGQSIVALLRESRNAQRLNNIGGELDNDIINVTDTYCASATATVANGRIVSITITANGSDYDPESPPAVLIGPQGGVFGGSGTGATAVAVVDTNTKSIVKIEVTNGGTGYTSAPLITIECPQSPERLGGPVVPGSFAGNEYTNQYPVSDNLISPDTASMSINEAIQNVTECNCDCWNV